MHLKLLRNKPLMHKGMTDSERRLALSSFLNVQTRPLGPDDLPDTTITHKEKFLLTVSSSHLDLELAHSLVTPSWPGPLFHSPQPVTPSFFPTPFPPQHSPIQFPRPQIHWLRPIGPQARFRLGGGFPQHAPPPPLPIRRCRSQPRQKAARISQTPSVLPPLPFSSQGARGPSFFLRSVRV